MERGRQSQWTAVTVVTTIGCLVATLIALGTVLWYASEDRANALAQLKQNKVDWQESRRADAEIIRKLDDVLVFEVAAEKRTDYVISYLRSLQRSSRGKWPPFEPPPEPSLERLITNGVGGGSGSPPGSSPREMKPHGKEPR